MEPWLSYEKPLPLRTAHYAVQGFGVPSGARDLLVESLEAADSRRMGHRAESPGKGRGELYLVVVKDSLAEGEQ